MEVGLVVVEEDQRRGPDAATWREISEPIEPPAPVISTRRPSSMRARVEVGDDLLAPEQVLDPQVADVTHRRRRRWRSSWTGG